MNMYRHISQFKAKQPKAYADLRRERLIKWRREPTVLRIDHPTNLARARSVGYLAKTGYVIVRARIRRGGRRKAIPARGSTKYLINGTTEPYSDDTSVPGKESRASRKIISRLFVTLNIIRNTIHTRKPIDAMEKTLFLLIKFRTDISYRI